MIAEPVHRVDGKKAGAFHSPLMSGVRLLLSQLIPSKVLGAADTVRQIRNDLVHNLSITSLVQLSPSRTDAMRGRLQEFGVPIEAGEKLPQLYNYLVTATTIALRLYAKHVETFNSFIRTDEFSSQWERYAETQRQ
jgi:hypothetical protein